MDQKRKILIIDNDEAVCSSITQVLTSRGFDVLVAAEPDEGVKKAKDNNPDLVFISLLFNQSNGLKVSKAIHSIKNMEKTPVIMLISYPGELDPRYTVTIGIFDVIVKPVNPEEVISKTLKILGEDTVSSDIEEITQESSIEEAPQAFSFEEQPFDLEVTEAVSFADTGEPLETLQEDIVELEDEEQPVDLEVTEPVSFADTGEPSETLQEDIIELEDEEQPVDLEVTEPVSFADAAEPSETLQEDIIELEDDNDIPEVFDESPKQDIEQAYKKEVSGIPAEDYPDNELDEKGIEETIDISDTQSEKDVDETSDMVSEEIPEEIKTSSAYSEDYEFIDKPEKSPTKKIVLVFAGILLIAALGIGAYQVKKLFFTDAKKETLETFLKEASEKKEPSSTETTIETIPIEDIKTKEAVAPPAIDKSKQEISPPVTIAKPKSVSKKPAIQTEAKALKQKIYSVQVGSFANEKNAASLVKKLKNKGYNAFIKKDLVDGKLIFHRVLIGKFDIKKKALEHSRLILQKESIKSIIYNH
jgi:DNA-binding response OmpR family regulator/cell division septation protein DedD